MIAAEQGNINSSLNGGVITPSSDPNINTINWLVNSPVTNYYPAGRLDYNPTDNLRFHATMQMSQNIQPTSGAPQFPGQYFSSQAAGTKSIYATYSVGVDWTIKPTVVNSFKIGYLYNPVWNPLYTRRPSVAYGYWRGRLGHSEFGSQLYVTDLQFLSQLHPVGFRFVVKGRPSNQVRIHRMAGA